MARGLATLIGLAALCASAALAPAEAQAVDPPPGELRAIRQEKVTGSAPTGPLPTEAKFAGKLNLQLPDGSLHYCTVMFIEDNVAITAAHCIRPNGQPNAPEYTLLNIEIVVSGATQTFSIKSVCTTSPAEWTTVADEYLRIRYDYAFIKIIGDIASIPGNPKNIRGNAFGKDVFALGYASASAPSTVSSRVERDVLHPTIASFETGQLGFTRGTSGGAWVDEEGRVVSINSSYARAVYDPMKMRVFGPLLGRDARALMRRTRNC